MGLLYGRIIKFYKEVIGIEFEENFFNVKDLQSELNFRRLSELITGIAAQCDKRGMFLQIMQNMENEDSTELFTILTERISAYTENMQITEFKKHDESDADDQTALYVRIEGLELENGKYQEEIKFLNDKIADLTKQNYTLELTIRETESKYTELVNSIEHRNSDLFHKKDFEDSVSLAIQMSELKGKLEAREKNLQKIREEKEKLVDEYKQKLNATGKENELLREKSIKYDVLKEKMEKFSIDEISNLKVKIIQSERVIKEQEEKIKKIKNMDVDKTKLLKRIEELQSELDLEKEKNKDIIKESNYYKDMIVEKENDLRFLKKQVETFNIQNEFKEPDNDNLESKFSLQEVEDDARNKRYVLELETRIKIIHSDKDILAKEKSDLEEKVERMSMELEENKKEMEKYTKKLDKYNKYKTEKHTLIQKINDYMEKLHEMKVENDNLKVQQGKEKVDFETKFNNQLNQLNHKQNEEVFSMKEIINKFENENNYLKKEVKKSEELNDSNKLFIEELQRKIANPNTNSETKLIEIETRLKELTDLENVELKKKNLEKEETINKQSEKLKSYESSLKEYSSEIEKLKKMSEDISVEEIKKRDDTITYYKTQLESREKAFQEEQLLLSSLIHQLALQYNVLKMKSNLGEGALNWNIEKSV